MFYSYTHILLYLCYIRLLAYYTEQFSSFCIKKKKKNTRMSGEMTGRKFRAIVGLMKVPERELMGDILLRESAEPSLPVHVNIGKFVRLDDGQYIDTEDRDKAVKRRQLANAKERLRVSECLQNSRQHHLFPTFVRRCPLLVSEALQVCISSVDSQKLELRCCFT